MDVFIHPLNYILSIYHVPGTVLATGNTASRKTNRLSRYRAWNFFCLSFPRLKTSWLLTPTVFQSPEQHQGFWSKGQPHHLGMIQLTPVADDQALSPWNWAKSVDFPSLAPKSLTTPPGFVLCHSCSWTNIFGVLPYIHLFSLISFGSDCFLKIHFLKEEALWIPQWFTIYKLPLLHPVSRSARIYFIPSHALGDVLT